MAGICRAALRLPLRAVSKGRTVGLPRPRTCGADPRVGPTKIDRVPSRSDRDLTIEAASRLAGLPAEARMPVVRKEDPGSKQKAVFATTLDDDPREDAKVVGQRIPCAQHIAGDEEISVGKRQPEACPEKLSPGRGKRYGAYSSRAFRLTCRGWYGRLALWVDVLGRKPLKLPSLEGVWEIGPRGKEPDSFYALQANQKRKWRGSCKNKDVFVRNEATKLFRINKSPKKRTQTNPDGTQDFRCPRRRMPCFPHTPRWTSPRC